MAGLTMLRVVSGDELMRAERDQARQDADARSDAPLMSGLAAYVRRCWDAAQRARAPIEERMLRALRQRSGRYEPRQWQAICEQGGSRTFVNLTEVKCRAAESWVRDILMEEGQPPWALRASPDPDLSPEDEQALAARVAQSLVQEIQATGTAPGTPEMERLEHVARQQLRLERLARAQERADLMQERIEDQFVEGGWPEAFSEFISDLVTYPAAFIKGPVVRRHRTIGWVQTGQGTEVDVTEELAPEYERVDPFRIYPEPGIQRIRDGYIIERHRMSRSDLADMIGMPGFDEDAVRTLLTDIDRGTFVDSGVEETRAELESRHDPNSSPVDQYDILEFWGKVSGQMLVDWGMDSGDIDDPAREYDANVWLGGRYVLRAVLNYDPLGEKPYVKSSFFRVPGAFWGRGIPEIISDLQGVCNAAIRALVNNMGIACLTADTVVYRHGQKNNPKLREVTIGELWESRSKHNSGLRRNLLRSLDETTGEFIAQRIKDIHYNGVRPVFRVTTAAGYVIKATSTHRFMSADGAWRRLESFAPGDLIAVNGSSVPLAQRRAEIRESHPSVDVSKLPATAVMTPEQARVDHDAHYGWMHAEGKVLRLKPACMDCGAPLSAKVGAKRCRRCASRKENSAWNMRQAQEAMSNDSAPETTARARALQRDQLKSACETCGTSDDLELHHIDKNPLNGSPENLMTLCSPCHHAWHARHDNFGKDPFLHRYLDYDRIVMIEALPDEPVYDLEMEAPHHNFVANGFVSHNSGPQVEINVERLPPGEDITDLTPWKVWQVTNDPAGSGAQALRFNQPESHASELMQVYERFARLADDHSGIPAYIYGDMDVQGAGRTSSGLSMLMGAAGKAIRQVIMHIDSDIVAPVVRRQFVWNMRYLEDEAIKGDVEVMPRGAISLAVRETTNVRRIEFLNATANPIDVEIIGREGRAAVLREVARGLQMPVDDVVPSRDKEQATQLAAAGQMPQPGQGPGAQNLHPDGQQKGGGEGTTSVSRGAVA